MRILVALLGLLFIASCGTKVPFTQGMIQEYDLTNEKMKKVQYYTSETIILERSDKRLETKTTGSSGELVSSESSSSERIIIPANVPCILEGVEDDGTVQIRFEVGKNRYLRFKERQNLSNGRYYLEAQWKNGKGELDYAGGVYYAVRSSASAYLMIKLKKWQKNQSKDRVIKGMKL